MNIYEWIFISVLVIYFIIAIGIVIKTYGNMKYEEGKLDQLIKDCAEWNNIMKRINK